MLFIPPFCSGNCFPHGALGFDVSPAAVMQATAKAVPVQMCYLSVSLLTLWLNRSSCGQRAISALYHTIWHLMESFRVFSWKSFLPSIAGSFEEINILRDAEECPEKQLSFPTQIQAWHHPCLQYDFHILWISACLGANNVCQPGKPPVYFWRPSVSRKWCKAGGRTVWNNKTTLLSQGKNMPSVCSLAIYTDENSLLLSYSKLASSTEGEQDCLSTEVQEMFLTLLIWDLHKVLAISNNRKLRILGEQPWLTPGESGKQGKDKCLWQL